MSAIKTAISIPDVLIEKTDNVARKLSLSRSKLFTIAMQEWLERYESKQLLESINASVADDDQCEERELTERFRRGFPIEKEEW